MRTFVKKIFECPGTLLFLCDMASPCKSCISFLNISNNYILVYTFLICLYGRQTYWPTVSRNTFATFSTNCLVFAIISSPCTKN